MSGYPIIFGEGVDPDAYQYFLRAGIASGTQTPTAYDNAASFNGTNQFLSVADNASINLSGTNFTLSCWYFVSALNTANAYVFGKAVLNLLPLDYGFRINANTTTTQFLWSTSGSYSVLTGPSVVLGAWNHLTIVFDGTNLTMYGNGVAGTPVAMPAAIQNTANPLSIGLAGANNSQYLNGRVAAFGLWKRALTASEVTALFNSGAGRTYASLDSGLRTNLISWWALNQNSVTADSHGTNTLTNNGSVTAPNIGPIVTSLADSRRLISDFVKGIKSLGLWNSMVCWPLRASQNAGSGTTAFSLGGLGRFNGTLVNAPVWGANGIRFSPATTQHINCATGNSGGFLSSTFYSSTSQLLNMVVATPYAEDGSKIATFNHGASTAGSDGIAVCVGAGNSGTYRGRYMLPNLTTRTGGNENWVWDSTDSAYLYTLNSPKSLITQVVGGVASTRADNNAPLTGAYSVLPTSFLDTCKVGAGFGASAPSGSFTIPFSLIGNLSTSTSQLYSLYKQTLGLGLGLP
jgi:hypothetical protein